MRVALALGIVVLFAGACSSFEEGKDAPLDADAGPTDASADTTTEDATDAALDATPALDPTLLAYWKLDDTGDMAADAVGENPGTRQGGSWAAGRVGGGFATGGSGTVVIPLGPRIVAPDVFTVAMWLNLDEKTGDDSYVFTHGYSFYIKLNSRTPQLGMGSDLYYQGTRDVPSGGWHHLAVTFDAGVPAIWVDGLLSLAKMNKLPPDTRPAAGTDPITLGSANGATAFAVGIIDDVRFYGRVLTQAEIEALANPK